MNSVDMNMKSNEETTTLSFAGKESKVEIVELLKDTWSRGVSVCCWRI